MKSAIIWVTFFGVISVLVSISFKANTLMKRSVVLKRFGREVYGFWLQYWATFLTPPSEVLYMEIPINALQLFWLVFSQKIFLIRMLKWKLYCTLCMLLMLSNSMCMLAEASIMEELALVSFGAFAIALVSILISIWLFYWILDWESVHESLISRYFGFTLALSLGLKCSYLLYMFHMMMMAFLRYEYNIGETISSIFTVFSFFALSTIILVIDMFRKKYVGGYLLYGISIPQIILSGFTLSKYLKKPKDNFYMWIMIVFVFSCVNQIAQILYMMFHQTKQEYVPLNDIDRKQIEDILQDEKEHLKMVREKYQSQEIPYYMLPDAGKRFEIDQKQFFQ